MTHGPRLTRLKWRLGRKLYMDARGEERFGTIDRNGEAFAISRLVDNTRDVERLVAFDIGANQGEWTEHLLNAMPEALRNPDRLRIHAFEPVPPTAEMFRIRIAAFPETARQSVSLHECAMSDAPGTAQIGVYAAGAGTNSLHFNRDERPTETTIKIALTTLDDFRAEHGVGHIHFAKCDTEGHDAKVIKGAADTLAGGNIDVLQFEYNHRWVLGRAFLMDIFDMIDGLPYHLVRLNENGMTLFETWHPELDRFFQSNYALLHDRALDWFPLHRGRFDKTNTYA